VKTHDRLDEFDPARGSAVTVGVFDGFHLGHAKIVEALREEAARLGVPSCVLTFRTHPRSVLSEAKQNLITSIEHRLVLLERAGVDATLAIEFTKELAAVPARAFVKDTLGGKLGARALVLGQGACLGAGCEADAEKIREIAEGSGIEVRIVEPVLVDGKAVSSTRVREAIRQGDLETAERLLGRRVSVLGKVVTGRGRGSDLGFPTANLDLHHEVRPPHGVYATWAELAPGEGKRLASVTNVGYRPTFVEGGEPAGAGERLVEVHLLEPPGGELGGRTVEAEFVKKLRDERRFESDAALAEQIARDVEQARAALEADGPS